jgi:hypothetical protein
MRNVFIKRLLMNKADLGFKGNTAFSKAFEVTRQYN